LRTRSSRKFKHRDLYLPGFGTTLPKTGQYHFGIGLAASVSH
jgi:hypothetical protein